MRDLCAIFEAQEKASKYYRYGEPEDDGLSFDKALELADYDNDFDDDNDEWG